MNIVANPVAAAFPLIPHVRPHHIQEWLDSGVDPGIIAMNVESLTDLVTSAGGDVETPIHDRLHWDYKRYSMAPGTPCPVQSATAHKRY